MKEGSSFNTLNHWENRAANWLLRHRLAYIQDTSGTDVSFFQKQISYLSNFYTVPNRAQNRLQDSHVTIIGVGGIGSVILQHLVGAGIQKFHLIDGDLVEKSNFNRQFIYSLSDVGSLKANAAKNYVLSRTEFADVFVSNEFVLNRYDLESIIFEGTDIIIVAADKPHSINHFTLCTAWHKQIPIIFGGVGIRWGHWGPLLDMRRKKNIDLARSLLNSPLNENVFVPQSSFGPTNSFIGVKIANDVISFISGSKPPLSFNRKLTVNFEDLKFY